MDKCFCYWGFLYFVFWGGWATFISSQPRFLDMFCNWSVTWSLLLEWIFFILSLQPVTKKKENCDPRLPNIYTLWISFHLNSDEVFFKVRRWRLIERIIIDCGCCNIRIKVSKGKVASENSKQNRLNWPKPLTLRLNLQVSLLSTIQFL